MTEHSVEQRFAAALRAHRKIADGHSDVLRRLGMIAATYALEVLTSVEGMQAARITTRPFGIIRQMAVIEATVWISPKHQAVERFQIAPIPAAAALRLLTDIIDIRNPAVVAMGSRIPTRTSMQRDVTALLDMHAPEVGPATPTLRAVLETSDVDHDGRTLMVTVNPNPSDELGNYGWLTNLPGRE